MLLLSPKINRFPGQTNFFTPLISLISGDKNVFGAFRHFNQFPCFYVSDKFNLFSLLSVTYETFMRSLEFITSSIKTNTKQMLLG